MLNDLRARGARWMATALRAFPYLLTVPGILFLATPPAVMHPALNGVDLINSWPQIWLQVWLGLVLVSVVAQILPSLAALVTWMLFRAVLGGWQPEGTSVILWTMVGLLVLLLGRWAPERVFSSLLLGLTTAFAVNAIVGVLNLSKFYPILVWAPEVWYPIPLPHTLTVDGHVLGYPIGQLPHPNTWSMFMALMTPLVWWATRTWCVSMVPGMLLLVFSGHSRLALASVMADVVLVAWRARGWLLGLIVAVALTSWGTAIMIWFGWWAREWSGGRWRIWALAFPSYWRWKLIGTGIGMWERWSNSPAGLRGIVASWSGWFSSPHNEWFYLGFEQGAVGLGLAILVVWQMTRAGVRVWQRPDPLGHALLGVLVVAFVGSWWTPLLHSPILAVTILLAAGRVLRLAGETR